MTIINFPECNLTFAKDQPQYIPLPGHIKDDETRTFICAWELSDEDIETLKKTKTIWHSIYTFGHELQPQLLQIEKPDMP